jgi:hypothetical protein
MTTEIATTSPSGNSLATKMQYANAMAGSNLLPRQYQKQPANLLFALEYAEALGVSPIHAITSIHVIEGKPTASADLIAALVRKAGHKLRVTGNDDQCTAVLIRNDDPDFEFTATWTKAKAQAAGLVGKAVWKNYPGAMLRSRAITEVARMGAPDALYGVIYTPEELGAPVDSSGEIVDMPEDTPAPAAPRTTTRQRRQPDPIPAPKVTTEPAPEPDAAPEPEPSEPAATTAQITKVNIMLQELGQTDRPSKLRFLSDWTARTITSSKDLTKAEAHRFIEENTVNTVTGELADLGETEYTEPYDPTTDPEWGNR